MPATLTCRPACARRPRCRGPDGNAPSDRRPGPAAPAPAPTAARGGQQRVGRDDAVALRDHQRHAGVDQFLLRVEHVERGALADAASSRTPFSAISAAVTCCCVALDLRLGGFELAPGLHAASAGPDRARCRGRCGAAAASPWPDGSSRIRRRPDRSES